jgi:two-component sensor histidine kinase
MSDPTAQAALSDTRQRISALALIYRALYQGEDLRSVDLSEFLEELIAQLVLADVGASGSIRTALTLEPLVIDPDRLAPLALFAVEAISNAKKHGLQAAGGQIRVALTATRGVARLDISDSGSGDDGPEGTGVGRTLMKGFARQLRGEAAFFANPEGGLTTRLTFPTHGDDDISGASARAQT